MEFLARVRPKGSIFHSADASIIQGYVQDPPCITSAVESVGADTTEYDLVDSLGGMIVPLKDRP